MTGFWRHLTIKWKLTIIFILLMLIPVVVLSLSMTNILETGFAQEYQRSKEYIVDIVKNMVELHTTEIQRSIKIITQDRPLLDEIAAARDSENSAQLTSMLNTLSNDFSLDVLEIRSPANTLITGVYSSENTGTGDIEAAVVQRVLEGTQHVSLVSHDDIIGFQVITMIGSQEDIIGIIKTEIFMDNDFARQVAAISGEEIAIFKEMLPICSSNEPFQAAAQQILPQAHADKVVYMQVGDSERAIVVTPFTDHADQPVGTIVMGLSTAEMQIAQRQSMATVIKLAGGLVLLMSLLVYGIAAFMTRPLTQLTTVARAIGRGETRLDIPKIKGQDEIGALVRAFQSVIEYFQHMTQAATRIASGDLHHEIVPNSPNDLLGNAFQQMSVYLNNMAFLASSVAGGDLTQPVPMRSTTDTFSQVLNSMTEGLHTLIIQIQNSAEQIAAIEAGISLLTGDDIEIVKNVHTAVKKMIATIHEIGESVEEVVSNMEVLSSSVDETSASVEQMTSSIGHIANNTTQLTEQINKTSNFLNETVTALETIVGSTDTSKQLSQGTIQEALKGQEAIEQVTTSMETLQATITTAVEAMSSFSERSQDIGTILDVIRNITEQTTLLALNASIIAAQAGVHGRGFAVVANEIKSLADGVSASTKDIGIIVNTLQQEAGKIVETIHQGAENTTQGMERTLQARETLRTIIDSAKESSSVVTQISDALHALMINSQGISTSMNQVKTLTEEINIATSQQKTSTIQINKAVVQINELASHIQQSATYQSSGLQEILQTTNGVAFLIDQNYESSQKIIQVTEELALQAGGLLQSVDRFKLKA